MEYRILTQNLRLEQFDSQLRFMIDQELYDFGTTHIRDDYAASSKFGTMHGDDLNAISHAVQMIRLVTRVKEHEKSTLYQNILYDDFQNLLYCYKKGMRRYKEYIKELITSILAIGNSGNEVANKIEQYYLGYSEEMSENSHDYALDFSELYGKAGDRELFINQNIALAMRFYRLASLEWDRSQGKIDNMRVNSWHIRIDEYEKLFADTDIDLKTSKMDNTNLLNKLIEMRRYLTLGGSHAEVVKLTDAFFQEYNEAISKPRLQIDTARNLVILAWSIRKHGLLSALCCLKDDKKAVIAGLSISLLQSVLSMNLHDAPTRPLIGYIAAHRNDVQIANDVLNFALTIDISKKIRASLRTNSVGQEMAYYTSMENLMYMLPDKCKEKRDYGKLSVMNLAYMNDPNEGRILKRFLLSGQKKEIISERKNTYYPFVFMKCFTSRIDDLPMWEMYGNHAEGCCIIIDWDHTLKGTTAKETPLYRVCYLRKDKNEYKLLKSDNPNLDNIDQINRWLKKLRTIQGAIEGDQTQRYFDDLLEGIAYLFKDSNYHYEQELRILYTFSGSSDQFKHTSGEYPMLFVQPEFPIHIKEIIVGPKFKNVSLRMPYIQEQLEIMCKVIQAPCPLITISGIDYR